MPLTKGRIFVSTFALGSTLCIAEEVKKLRLRKPEERCKPKTAVVVGGGIIGISSALQLAKRGIAVTVLEENDEVSKVASYCNGAIICNSMAASWASANLIGNSNSHLELDKL